MKCRTIVVEPSAISPFHVEALQYIPDDTQDDGLTLILFHAMNLHKETFHVMVTRLLEDKSVAPALAIKDVWCIDNPNHGRSAVLNADLLSSDEWKEKWGGMEYARAAYALLSTTSHGVDFRKRNLVGMAHSAGAVSLMLLQDIQPKFNFRALILMEPGLLPPTHPSAKYLPELFSKMALSKRSNWSRREEGHKELSTKAAYKAWHPDVFNLFIAHGLRQVDSSGAVTLACTPKQESAHYCNADIVVPPSAIFERMAKEDKVPIHLIEVRKDEYRGKSDEMKRYHIDVVSKMKNGSVQYMEKGGHLWPQVEPALAAQVIRSALAKIHMPCARL